MQTIKEAAFLQHIFFTHFQFRKGGLIKEQDQLDTGQFNRDEFNWPLCTNGDSHPIRKLLLAQIIPKNELVELAHKVHNVRHSLSLNQFCHKADEFSEVFSLQRLANNKSRVIALLRGRKRRLFFGAEGEL
jgi:hypothetical protein